MGHRFLFLTEVSRVFNLFSQTFRCHNIQQLPDFYRVLREKLRDFYDIQCSLPNLNDLGKLTINSKAFQREKLSIQRAGESTQPETLFL